MAQHVQRDINAIYLQLCRIMQERKAGSHADLQQPVGAVAGDTFCQLDTTGFENAPEHQIIYRRIPAVDPEYRGFAD
jgi:hypothetical protein